MANRITIKRYKIFRKIYQNVCITTVLDIFLQYFFEQPNLIYVSFFKFQDDGSAILMSM